MEKKQISYRIEKGRLKGVLIFLCELVTVKASKNKSTNGKSKLQSRVGDSLLEISDALIIYSQSKSHFFIVCASDVRT